MSHNVDSFLQALGNDSPATLTPAKKPRREWKPLLGQMLEYGDSGFVIVLQKNSKRAPFSLRDPEGRELATGDNMKRMKDYAEEQARYRDEFDMGVGLSGMFDFKKFQSGDA
jgi:hypothetical protein